jgi:uncharacterized membrane protein
MAAVAYYILSKTIISVHGKDSVLSSAIGKDLKGIISAIGYAVAVLFAFFQKEVSICIIVAIAILWLIPDRRIEKKVNEED